MVEILVRGLKDEAAVGERAEDNLGLLVTVKDAVRIPAGRGAAETVGVEAADDDVVELRLDGGAVLWMRADEVAERLGAVAARGGVSDQVVDIGSALPIEDSARGIGAWAIEALRVLGIDLAGQSARQLAEAFDERAVPSPGLFHWDGGQLGIPFDKTEPGNQPWLVFIHGTASSTLGSFGDLPTLQPGIWQKLHATYGERILGLEHRTLTESPAANALALLRALPAEAELHLVSHSRGGLVGELLGRGRLTDAEGQPRAAFDEIELGLFAGETHGAQHAELVELNEALARKRLRVTRFARIACPARGTSLMGGRIDRWLNLVFNVASFALGGRLNPVTSTILDALRALVQAMVKERTDPGTLPGLAAMSPDSSPLLQVLNRFDVWQEDGLYVIAGDAAPTELFRRLALWFADLYFGGDHDLVVDTASMDGGAPRQTTPLVFSDRGAAVTHFNYFANAGSAGALASALTATAAARGIGEELSRAATERMPDLRTRSAGQVPIVFVLPGISGSHLRIGRKRIWIDIFKLARGGVAELDIGNSRIEPDELIARYYGDLCTFLKDTHDVRTWAYDWRRSILDTAQTFARDLDTALETTDRAVRIVAHSMGGLVARTAFALDDALWQRFAGREGSRLVMLGTPNSGSFSIPMLLLGRNRLMQYLALLDIRASAADQLKVVARWPGIAQMLPKVDANLAATSGCDLFTSAGWKELAKADHGKGWSAPSADVLTEAGRFHVVFDKAKIDPERMFYITGQADTYDGFTIDGNPSRGERVRFTITTEGDGQVLWKTGIPKNLPAWYTTAAHGDLARHAPAFGAILDLLQGGTTDRLPRQPPIVARARNAPQALVREPVHRVPSEDDLLAVAIGGAPWIAPRQDRRVAICVVHGHLKHAKHPVLVGHYIGDSLNGSELTLDREQQGRISRRRDRGLHPGPIQTFDVHLDDKLQPPGSVIVGLGEVSDLAGGLLKLTIRRGLLALASAMDERDEIARAGGGSVAEKRPRGVSFVLIGSGAGVVEITDSLLAILRATREANYELGDAGFAELELIELVEQRAITAWHTIHDRINRAEFRAAFVLADQVCCRGGAWRRIGPEDDPSWWTPITIRSATEIGEGAGEGGSGAAGQLGAAGQPDRGALKYVVLSGRARAEASMVGTRRSFVDLYLHRVAQRRVEEGATSAGRTLFELLWPNRLKEHSLDDRSIRLILDETAAALPWEMLDDRRPWLTGEYSAAGSPLGPPVVRYGVIRQLVSSHIREATISAGSRRRALVIGDPIGGGSTLPELKGAQSEALMVKEALERRGYQVTAHIGASAKPEHVISALFAEAWDIVHIAAHGVFEHQFPGEPASEAKTGIVLGGAAKTMLLGRPAQTMVLDSAMLEQMPITPDLVFVNCCSLGAINPIAEHDYMRAHRPALASSIAVQLIRMGVRAVVAAGWEVGDKSAARFAETFYDHLLRGGAFGKVVQYARSEVYQEFPTDSTWGAYQCYGHPDFHLPHLGRPERHSPEPHVFAAPAEAVSTIERVATLGQIGGGRDAKEDLKELRRIEEAVAAKGWLGLGEIHGALAKAFAELEDLDKALEHYAAAAMAEDAAVPIRGIEQQLNLIARRPRPASDTKDSARAAAEIMRSIKQLRALIRACGETQERLSLIGSGHKRLAQRKTGEERTKELARMEEAYRRARKVGQRRGTSTVFYPWSQELAGQVIVALRGGNPSEPDFAALRRSLPAAASDDFWLRVLPADLRLLEIVADGARVADAALVKARREEIVQMYKAVWKDTGSRREMTSVLGQVNFLIDMLTDLDPAPDDLLEALRAVQQDLDEAARE